MEIAGFGLMNKMDDIRFSGAMRGTQNFTDIIERMRASENNDMTTRRGEGIVRDEKLFELCLELETFLVKNLLTTMRNTVQKSGLIEDSFAGKIYEDMLWDEYAKVFTRSGTGFGLAEQAYQQLRLVG